MNIRSIYIYLIACVLLVSCKKYLDIKPKGSLIPVSVTDYDHLLDNTSTIAYNFLDNNLGCQLSYLTDNVALSEGQAKVGYVLNSHPNIARYYSYVFRQPYSNPTTNDYFWSSGSLGCYSQISYFNNVIDGIRSVPNKNAADELLAKRSIAQALVARAWCYFNLNLVYGPVYNPAGNNTTKTVPFVTSGLLTDPIPDLSTSAEMMKNVLQDLHAAVPDLPETSSWPSRANKATGLAMLAYCHLFTAKYDSVAYYANLAWVSGTGGNAAKVIYDYNQFSLSTPANVITSLIKTPQDAFINAGNSREMLFFRYTDNTVGQGPALSYPSAELTGLYDQANDLRFQYFYLNAPGYKTSAGGGYDDGMRISNYRGSKTRMTDAFTYPELLLMRAEGYARTNQLGPAIDDLNTLRQYRFKPGTPQLTVGTQDQVIAQVLNERRRELPLGGLKRFLDLKRFVLETGKPWSKTQITHTVGAQSYTGNINSSDFILPITNAVLGFNPKWGVPLDTRPF